MQKAQNASTRFESERDVWLFVAAWGAVIICCISLAPLLIMEIGNVIKFLLMVLLVLTVSLVTWVSFSTYYVIKSKELFIRSGPFHWSIPLTDIHRVSNTRAAWSSPALSLNRLRLDYSSNKCILVSPKNQARFIHKLGMSVSK